MDLARLRAGLRPHPPKSAGSVDVPAVRNKKNFFSIPRPYRVDLVIEHAVVIAGQGTLGFACQPGYVFQLSVPHFRAKNMKSLVVRGRNKNNLLSTGCPSLLPIHCAAAPQWFCLP